VFEVFRFALFAVRTFFGVIALVLTLYAAMWLFVKILTAAPGNDEPRAALGRVESYKLASGRQGPGGDGAGNGARRHAARLSPRVDGGTSEAATMNDVEGRRRSTTMNTRLTELEEKALQLTATERSELIGALIASLEGEAQGSLEEVRDAWDAEIERRIAEMEAGRTRFVDAAEALRTLRAHAEQRRSR